MADDKSPSSGDMNPGDEAPPGTPGTGEDLCRDCDGTGKRDGEKCPTCNGTGLIIEGTGGA
jgi:DnaJ-class molecular chaperone